MKKEELLFNIIFPESSDPNHINYGYFVGKNKRSLFRLKSALYDSQINPLLLNDPDHENAFFAKVLESEVDEFLKYTREFNFKQIRLSKRNIEDVKWIFNDIGSLKATSA